MRCLMIAKICNITMLGMAKSQILTKAVDILNTFEICFGSFWNGTSESSYLANPRTLRVM